MVRLLVDIGNSRSKVAIFDGEKYTVVLTKEHLTVDDIVFFDTKYLIDKIALSTVGAVCEEFLTFLRDRFGSRFFEFDYITPIPISNRYETPQTLGCDRLLAAIAANDRYPFMNCLIVDMGSAITIDFVNSDSEYLGGVISVGLSLRLKALNAFTSKLPMVDLAEKTSLIGKNTKEAIAFGAINGVYYELKGYIDSYKLIFGDMNVLFTGGDSDYFSKKLSKDCSESNVILCTDLVFRGLNIVLDYNAKKE